MVHTMLVGLLPAGGGCKPVTYVVPGLRYGEGKRPLFVGRSFVLKIFRYVAWYTEMHSMYQGPHQHRIVRFNVNPLADYFG